MEKSEKEVLFDEELLKELTKLSGVPKELLGVEKTTPSYWQTSMEYYCSGCHKNFLIGWRHKYTLFNYCDDCKEKSYFDKSEFIELIY